MSAANLVIEDLHVSVEDKEILHGVDLVVEQGKVHALMGPNGSGKSTLAYALAGHPRYRVTGGRVAFEGEDVLSLTPDERARLGMFLAMQYPVEVPGVSVTNFLRTALNVVREGVNRMRGPDLGVLLITHYTRILRYVAPDVVHVMLGGRIAQTGGRELADDLGEHGNERPRTTPPPRPP